MDEPIFDLRCQACGCKEETCLINAPEDLVLRHCAICRLTSVVNPVTTVNYDQSYIAERYDRYETTDRMSRLRLSFVETAMKLWEALPQGCSNLFAGYRQLLDVGYGNGAFIRVATQNGWEAWGNDVNPTVYPGVHSIQLPDPVTVGWRFRAITFFDALEHFENLYQVRRVSACTEWIFVTVPLPPVGWPMDYGTHELGEWKHYRPGEHHHSFHPKTLEHLFSWEDEVAEIQTVATVVHVSHFEDSIRGAGPDGRPNTFSAALRCMTLRNGWRAK